MLVDLSILITCSFAITVLGLFILARNPAQANNRRFACLSAALVAWSVFNYLSDHSSSHVLLYTRLTFLGGIAAIYTVINFIANFPNGTALYKSPYLRLHAVFTALALPITFSPAFIRSVTVQPPHGNINTGPLYWLFVAYVAYSLVLLFLVIHKQRVAAQSASEKLQVSFVSWGIILYAILAILSNVALPLLIDSWSSSRFGPAFTLFLTGMVAYAIVRHKLFDIRLIVARSLAYVFSLLTLGAIFTIAAFSITNLFFNGNSINVITLRWLYAFLAVVLAILFPPMKQFFDKVTNRLFFRDAYDTRVFLDEFNKTLAVTRELDQLLKQSATLIEQNIKPEYCVLVINGTKGTKARTSGSGNGGRIDGEYIAKIKTSINHISQKLVVTDELNRKNSSLQKLLREEDVVMLARLTPSLTTARFDIGYLLLGPKKSGNLYSSQDLQVIEIIANELIIAIQNALRFEEIQNFNLTLQRRIDEATKKLRHANEKLRQLDETKDDFISMASHQLRTPLTSVKGYISMVLEGDAGKINSKQREMLGQAFFSSQRMVYLIADLLNVSRLKTGKFVIEPTPVNLAQMVKEELEQLEESASSHSLTLSYDKPKKFPELMLDETKTRQVIMNFVDNAIYYTPGGGHITVHLKDNRDTVELRVEDDGIGVPRSEQPHLFTKFYRAGNARKQRPDGTGLGLFMAKKVVVAQGGSITFESQEGKGSTFGFILSKGKLTPKKT
jgi:signal transduction histidine kinase